MIRALIADDEALVRQFLRAKLDQEPDVSVVAECANAEETIASIAANAPDVAFLDVQMPGGSAFDIIATVGTDRMPLVVFVTAFDEYAIQAFDVCAIDYLLKPFDAERLKRAVERVRARLGERGRADLTARLERLLASQSLPARRIAVRSGEKIELVDPDEIDWVEAQSNYVILHVGSRGYILRQTLSTLEKRLDPRAFARVHRSFIVNLARVRQIHPLFHGDYELVLADGTRISTGRTYLDVVQRLLDRQ